MGKRNQKRIKNAKQNASYINSFIDDKPSLIKEEFNKRVDNALRPQWYRRLNEAFNID